MVQDSTLHLAPVLPLPPPGRDGWSLELVLAASVITVKSHTGVINARHKNAGPALTHAMPAPPWSAVWLLRVLGVLLGLVEGRPARGGVDVLVLAVPVPVHHLACWVARGERGRR